MSPILATAASLTLLAAGYALGRARPAHRASDWANWQKYDSALRRRRARWWTVFVILSAENLTWLLLHPARGWHAWQHRNDPPPPRGPALQFDPDWAAKRRAATDPQSKEN